MGLKRLLIVAAVQERISWAPFVSEKSFIMVASRAWNFGG